MKAVNLLPTDQRGGAKPAAAPAPSSGSPLGAYLLLGALGLAVVMAAAYAVVGNAVKDRRAELARVQSEAQTVRAQAAALKPYADFRQLATQRVATVQQLAASRFDWEQALRDVSRALPADVHLKSFKGSVSGASAGAPAPAAGATPATPTIAIEGCTNTQSDVAKMMARLRAVRGVTRVSLTKSEKPATASSSAAATGTGSTAGLCGQGAKPDFAVTMHFERSAVAAPSAATPGQPAAPASGAPAQAPDGAQPAQPTDPAQPAGGPQSASTPASTASTTQGASTP